jgi:FkbM family methyltransferase
MMADAIHPTICHEAAEARPPSFGALDRVLAWVTASDRLTSWLTRTVRTYIRYAPFAAGKCALWSRVVDPYLAWQGHEFVAHTSFGSRIAGDTRDILQQYLYYFGVWEPHLTRWISQRLATGDTFVDVGANIGYFSLLASRRVGQSGTVVAIEPSPTIFRALRANLERNRAGNVRALNLAVSDAMGSARLFRGPDTNCGLTTFVEAESSVNHCKFEGEVDTAPLPTVLRPEEILRARLIKIDVEGAEWPVVAGMAPLLAAGREDLEVMVEVDPARLTHYAKSAGDVLAVFREAGFHAYAIENDYSPWSYLAPGRVANPMRIRGPIEQETDVVFSRQDARSLSTVSPRSPHA